VQHVNEDCVTTRTGDDGVAGAAESTGTARNPQRRTSVLGIIFFKGYYLLKKIFISNSRKIKWLKRFAGLIWACDGRTWPGGRQSCLAGGLGSLLTSSSPRATGNEPGSKPRERFTPPLRRLTAFSPGMQTTSPTQRGRFLTREMRQARPRCLPYRDSAGDPQPRTGQEQKPAQVGPPPRRSPAAPLQPLGDGEESILATSRGWKRCLHPSRPREPNPQSHHSGDPTRRSQGLGCAGAAAAPPAPHLPTQPGELHHGARCCSSPGQFTDPGSRVVAASTASSRGDGRVGVRWEWKPKSLCASPPAHITTPQRRPWRFAACFNR